MSGKTAGQQPRSQRDKLEAAIWSVYNTGDVPPTVRVEAALRAIDAYAEAVETGQVRLAREDRDQLRKQVLDLRDALERCRDAAGRSPAAVHTIASQALASTRAEPPS
jgi:hypothetical protein